MPWTFACEALIHGPLFESSAQITLVLIILLIWTNMIRGTEKCIMYRMDMAFILIREACFNIWNICNALYYM